MLVSFFWKVILLSDLPPLERIHVVGDGNYETLRHIWGNSFLLNALQADGTTS